MQYLKNKCAISMNIRKKRENAEKTDAYEKNNRIQRNGRFTFGSFEVIIQASATVSKIVVYKVEV